MDRQLTPGLAAVRPYCPCDHPRCVTSVVRSNPLLSEVEQSIQGCLSSRLTRHGPKQRLKFGSIWKQTCRQQLSRQPHAAAVGMILRMLRRALLHVLLNVMVCAEMHRSYVNFVSVKRFSILFMGWLFVW